MSKDKLTPLMEQYFQIRKDIQDDNPEAIMLFQVGDFYELFFEDAKVVSSFLAIALTKRGKCKGGDIPLCGIPVHAARYYITKLVRGGFKVAICDQLSEPKPGMIVERGVTQIYTPGTLTDAQMLDEKSASYLLSFYPVENDWGLIFGELLTAQLFATRLSGGDYRMLESELSRFLPDEVIVPNFKQVGSFSSYFRKLGYWVSISNFSKEAEEGDDVIGEPVSKDFLMHQFGDLAFKKFESYPALHHAVSLFFNYLKKTQNKSSDVFKSIQFYEPDDYLVLDVATQKNLEIIKNGQDGSRKNSLLSVLDKSKTAMGSRTIKKWLARQLVQEKAILQRQEVVGAFSSQIDFMQKLEQLLVGLSDLERIVGRIALSKASLQDYLALKDSLRLVFPIRELLLLNKRFYLVQAIVDKLKNFSSIIDLLEASLNNEPGSKKIIKKGFDHKLDRLRNLVENAQQEILKLEQREISKTGISNLKIRYNKITGYLIEVTKVNLHLVPKDYIRQQTLSNRERYVTPELMELEREINKAQSEIDKVEAEVFNRVKGEVLEKLSSLRQLSFALSYLDSLYSLASVAYDNGYVAPIFNENRDIIIEEARHPVIEQSLEGRFIPNGVKLTNEESLLVITGPNMGGKSTYLRQVALICIMAQCGSLIPAKSASLSIVDRIFTRIGSGDNLAEGKSTFLVEMEETAVICSQATKNSLVILDEVGRGTSTYDGLAIAQAVIEYIYQKIGARSLFATHYHELTHLKDYFPGIKNYYMSSEKTSMGIVFLYRIMPGISSGSFGIEVAKLALLPGEIINRAKKILGMLNQVEQGLDQKLFSGAKVEKSSNQDFIELEQEIKALKVELHKKEAMLKSLQEIDLDNLTPRQAFDLLWEIKKNN